MSKLFYDDLTAMERLEEYLREAGHSAEEKEEIWRLIDEIVHHRVMDAILSELPGEHHEEFLVLLHECPYDKSIMVFINERTGSSMDKIIKNTIQAIEEEMLSSLG